MPVSHRRCAGASRKDGRVSVHKEADAVGTGPISQFADSDGETWRITAQWAASARTWPPRQQVLGWLEQHAGLAVPPLLETILRNWLDGGGVFLGELLLLQAPQEQA